MKSPNFSDRLSSHPYEKVIFNVRQYIVMLIEISQENCPIVSKRIAKKFNKLSGDKKFTQVDFYVASIGEMCEMEG